MSLADFMLPDVVPPSSSLTDLAGKAPSTGMFHGFDPVGAVGLRGGELLPAGSPEDVFDRDAYKGHRNANFVESLHGRPTAPIFWDMEDARAMDADVHFGRPLNVFQYNRRVGSRNAVLWRLRAYFEPSRNVGHPGVIVDDATPFLQKQARVFWRGAMVGSRWLDPHHRSGPLLLRSVDEFRTSAKFYSRLRAVLMSNTSDNLDLKLTGSVLDARPWVADLDVRGEHATPEEQIQHRYILCPNGNDVASGLYWVLQTNSLALREDCAYEVVPDYFLKPWVHYVPVARGLADLEEKFAYCEAHPDECLRIIDNAHEAYARMTDRNVWLQAELEVLSRLGFTELS